MVLIITEYFNTKYAQAQPYEEMSMTKIKMAFLVDVIEVQNETNYKHMHYDFKTSDERTYEVKVDFMSSKTGNFFIEMFGYGKPSGFSITTATHHILISNETFYVLETCKIHELIKTGKFRLVETKTSQTSGFIVPVSIIAALSDII